MFYGFDDMHEEFADFSNDLVEASMVFDIDEAVKRAAKSIKKAVKTTIKRKGLVDTGELHGSVIVVKKADGVFDVEVTARHGRYIEYGTAERGEFKTEPYDIYPINGRALSFEYNGDHVVVSKVENHPGVKPHPFFRPAVQRMENLHVLEREIEKEIDKAFRQVDY